MWTQSNNCLYLKYLVQYPNSHLSSCCCSRPLCTSRHLSFFEQITIPAEYLMENGHGIYSKGSIGWSSTMKEKFQEENIWGVFININDCYSQINPAKSVESITTMPKSKIWQLSSSTPAVNVPDWSKIYRKSSADVDKYSCFWLDHSDDHYGFESDEEDVIPPHEWIARKVERSPISSFSVCEGAGRTLKGRDLSRVRNAVLTRTGFLES